MAMATSSVSGWGIGLLYVVVLEAHFLKEGAWGVNYIYGSDPSILLRRAAEGVVLCCAVVTWMFHMKARRHRECYMVDFSCYRAPDHRKMNAETSIYFSLKHQPYVAEHLDLQWRVYLRSGLGDETAASRFLFEGEGVATMEEARVEMEESFVAVLDELFAKTHVKPQQIDILIVTVSTFTSAASHASWIVNRYKMKENVKSFNISGMGCSASVLGVDMAKDLFKVYRDSYALVVGTEVITLNANYAGIDLSLELFPINVHSRE